MGCEIFKKGRCDMNENRCANYDPEDRLCQLCTTYSKKYKACYRKPYIPQKPKTI